MNLNLSNKALLSFFLKQIRTYKSVISERGELMKHLILLAILLLSGCSYVNEYEFEAEILNNHFLSLGLSSMEGLIQLNTNHCKNCDEFQAGDQVKVIYDGEIMESYPLQVNVLEMELIKSKPLVLMLDQWFYTSKDELSLTFMNRQEAPFYLLTIPQLEILEGNKFKILETNLQGCGVKEAIVDQYSLNLSFDELNPELETGHYRISFKVFDEESKDQFFIMSHEFDFEKIPQ